MSCGGDCASGTFGAAAAVAPPPRAAICWIGDIGAPLMFRYGAAPLPGDRGLKSPRSPPGETGRKSPRSPPLLVAGRGRSGLRAGLLSRPTDRKPSAPYRAVGWYRCSCVLLPLRPHVVVRSPRSSASRRVERTYLADSDAVCGNPRDGLRPPRSTGTCAPHWFDFPPRTWKPAVVGSCVVAAEAVPGRSRLLLTVRFSAA
jgi:hypothetical protein